MSAQDVKLPPIGIVNVNNRPSTHCASYWLFIGSSCRPEGFGRHMDYFYGQEVSSGFVVRISNESCIGEDTCPGVVCASNSSSSLYWGAANNYINCGERTGRYISVQLPGEHRVMGIDSVKVRI